MTQLAHQIYMQPDNLTRLVMYKNTGSRLRSQIITEHLRSVIDQYDCLAIDSHRTEMATLLVEGKLKNPPIYVVADETFELINRPFGSNKQVVHGFLFNPLLLNVTKHTGLSYKSLDMLKSVEFVLPSQRIFEAIESYHTTLKELP